MGLLSGVFDWIWTVALKKSASKGIKAGVAFIAAPTVLGFLSNIGINVEVNQELLTASVLAGLLAGYEFIRNYFKSKGLNFLP